MHSRIRHAFTLASIVALLLTTAILATPSSAAAQAPPTVPVTIEFSAPNGGATLVDFYLPDDSLVQLANGDSVTFDVEEDTGFTVGETLPNGWDATSFECDTATGLVFYGEFGFAEYNAFVGTDPVLCEIGNSGDALIDVTIVKVVEFDDGTSFDFTLPDQSNVELGNGDSVTFATSGNSGISFTEWLPPDGSWNVTDFDCTGATLFAYNYNFGSDFANFEVLFGTDPVTCTVTNSPDVIPIPVTITKAVENDDGSTFAFDLPGGTSAQLGHGDSVTLTVPEGEVVLLEEVLPSGWTATAFSCTGAFGSSFFSEPGVFAEFEVDVASSPVDCTVTNTRTTVPVTISLFVEDAEPTLFEFQLPDGSAVQLGHLEVLEFEVDINSDFELGQLLPPGWDAMDFDCDGATSHGWFSEPGEFATFEASVSVDPLVCSIMNAKWFPEVEVTFTAVFVDDDGSQVVLDPELGGFSYLGDGQSVTFSIEDLPGSYFHVDAQMPVGWTATDFECDTPIVYWTSEPGGDAAFEIAMQGEPVNCTITHTAVDELGECDGLPVTIVWGPGAVATPGNDVILGTSGPDNIEARGGNDVICGGGGDDTIRGGPGMDLIFGEEGDDVVNAGSGDDVVYGGSGLDDLRGGPGGDTIYGDDDADLLRGDGGTDFVVGGAGDDEVRGGPDDDELRGSEGNDFVLGSIGADLLIGGSGHDDMYGQLGADYLAGGAGNDWLRGGADNDELYGDSGNDRLDGNHGDDVLYGGVDDDDLNGTFGNDSLAGGAGDDNLSGGDGDDDLSGGFGTDVCFGNMGLDSAELASCETASVEIFY